jgi:AraC-like DNA-binding protein
MSRSTINLVHAEVLSPYVRALTRGGAPTERLFGSCGIPLEAVENAGAIITLWQSYQLMEKAARYAGEDSFGSTVGMDLKLFELGTLGHAVHQAPTLHDAGNVVMSAIRDSEPGSKCWIERHEKEAWFCYCPIERFVTGGIQAEQFDLEALLQFIRLAAGADWMPKKVRTSRVTEDALSQANNFANAAVEFGSRMTAVAFPSELLHKAILDAPVDPQSESGLGLIDACGISNAVVLILESLCEFQPLTTLDVIAERFRMNSRTFQRSLADEGTSYRRLTEQIMFRRAVHFLEIPSLSVKEIASELGYCSPSSFIRAFSRIAGTTPTAYRNIEGIIN